MLLEEILPSVETLTVKQIAKKHKVSVSNIESQLKKGIKVEKEHTTDPKVAREIALDHLAEFPDYYDRLQKVEEGENVPEFDYPNIYDNVDAGTWMKVVKQKVVNRDSRTKKQYGERAFHFKRK